MQCKCAELGTCSAKVPLVLVQKKSALGSGSTRIRECRSCATPPINSIDTLPLRTPSPRETCVYLRLRAPFQCNARLPTKYQQLFCVFERKKNEVSTHAFHCIMLRSPPRSQLFAPPARTRWRARTSPRIIGGLSPGRVVSALHRPANCEVIPPSFLSFFQSRSGRRRAVGASRTVLAGRARRGGGGLASKSCRAEPATAAVGAHD